MEDYKQGSVGDILERNRPYAELVSQVNNSLVWIMNRTTGDYLYLSPNFKDVMECDPSELRKMQPWDFMVRFIHPDDLPELIDIRNRFLDYVTNLPYEERICYKHILEFRVLCKGKYIRVTDQRQLLGISRDNMSVIQGTVDVSPDQTPGQAVNYRLVNVRTMDIVPSGEFIRNDGSGIPPGADTGNYKDTDAGSILEKNKTYIDLLIRSGNSCVYVIGKKTNTFLYMSPNFHDIWGYDPAELNQIQRDKYLVRHIHPDDIAVFAGIQDRVLEFIGTLSVEERMNFKYIFELRAQHKGKWIRIMSKHQLLGVSSDHGPVILGIVEISPNQTSAQTVSFRLVNAKTGDTVPFPVQEDFSNPLTRRELEILKLVNDGLLSKEISDRLSISIYTVNVHRQRILRKMNVHNLTEAINLARKMGLLA